MMMMMMMSILRSLHAPAQCKLQTVHIASPKLCANLCTEPRVHRTPTQMSQDSKQTTSS
jgi:hypothetical protein